MFPGTRGNGLSFLSRFLPSRSAVCGALQRTMIRLNFSPALLRPAVLAACLWLGGADARPADVRGYGILKEKGHRQTNSTPALLAVEPFSFSAFVIATNETSVSSATLLPAGGTVKALVRDTNSGNFLLTERFATESALNAAYPNANYTLTIQTANDGLRSPGLSLLSGTYPNAPRVANLAAAQAINATNAFTLQWDAFAGGTVNDLIQFVITDGASNLVFSSPTPGQSNSLDGLAVSYPIPAGTLAPGRAYTGNLLFARVFTSFGNQLIYPSVPGASAFAARTLFTLQTLPAPATRRPALRVLPATLPNVALAFDAEPGVAYRLEAATNLSSPNWITVLTTNAAATNITVLDASATARERFYRVVSP